MRNEAVQNLRYNKANKVIHKNVIGVYSVIYFILLFISCCATLFILIDSNKPNHYEYLFILPLVFIGFLLLNINNKKLFTNFGLSLLISLEFIRLVISPIFLALSGYVEMITVNVDVNTPKAILLMIYETVLLALVINLPVRIKKVHKCSNRQYSRGVKRLHVVMAVYTGILIVLCAITPQILLSHRTIIGVFVDKKYTAMQLDDVIAAFTGSTAKRYCLILSRLFLTPYRLLFPAYLIIVLRYKKIKFGKIMSVIISFFPFLLVSDVIAQSIYFSLFLLLLTMFIYNMGRRKTVLLFLLTALAVLVYFVSRFIVSGGTTGESFIENMSRKLFTYFSGLNIVSGAFNYPAVWADRFQYFTYEFLQAIPMHNLIGIDNAIAPGAFFNILNNVNGQIPTTIGMGYYYLGAIFAPVFSIVIAYLAMKFGSKMREETIPIYKLIYMFMSFISVLGIVMYNMNIFFNAVVQIVLPIYIVAVIAFNGATTVIVK